MGLRYGTFTTAPNFAVSVQPIFADFADAYPFYQHRRPSQKLVMTSSPKNLSTLTIDQSGHPYQRTRKFAF